ncbi:MAG: hypothetical protein J5747_01625, partial [Spirochaetaceae bacterium]|nr:hypothetical protein [Spirochaetaceae bacterium]
MAYYFDDSVAVYNQNNGDIKDTLNRISSLYMHRSPAKTFVARPFLNNGIRRGKDYRYCADLNKIYPDADNGDYAYMRGVYTSVAHGAIQFTLIPYGPVKIWMNGKEVFATDIFSERYANKAQTFAIPVKKGANQLVVRCTKTKSGFGAEFGTWLGKLDYRFSSGMTGYSEYEGIDITLPSKKKNELLESDPSAAEAAFAAPAAWSATQLKSGNFGRVFGTEAVLGRNVAAAVSYIKPSAGDYKIECKYSGAFTLYVSGKKVLSAETASEKTAGNASGVTSGTASTEIKLTGKKCLIEIVSECPVSGRTPTAANETTVANVTVPKSPAKPLVWNCEVTITGKDGKKVPFESVFFDERTPESAAAFPWAYTGLFSKSQYIPFNRSSLARIGNDERWYRLDKPDCWVRLYNENGLFGHWNYPLGVTLYGLVEFGRTLCSTDDAKKGARIKNYVKAHVAQSVAAFDYACFDKNTFGGATGVHHLLTSIDSLDDCGSFGSLMLEA